MGFLSYFGRRRTLTDSSVLAPERLEAVIESVVDRVNPRLRFVRDYKGRLAPAIERFIVQARERIALLPPAHEATAEAWVSDAGLRAFFTKPEDMRLVLSRSPAVRGFFRDHPVANSACGLLGMDVERRKVFGTELHGEVLRQDVPQETVSFANHRVNYVDTDEGSLRETLVRALGEQVLIEALAALDAAQHRLKQLRDERSQLASQFRILQSRSGLAGALTSDAEHAELLSAVKEELAARDRELLAAGAGSSALDRQLEALAKLIADPVKAVVFEPCSLRLNRMNVVVPEDSEEPAGTVDYVYLTAGLVKLRSAAVALLTISRSSVREATPSADEAAHAGA
jgi:hypothetical protein